MSSAPSGRPRLHAVGDGGRFALLYELGCAFAAQTELDALVPLVIAKCREVLQGEGAAVLLLDRDANELYIPFVAQEDAGVAERLLRTRIPATGGIAGAIVQSGRPMRIDDPYGDPRFYAAVDQSTRFTTRNMIAAPLLTREGTIGVIEVVNHIGGGPFSDADLRFLETLAGSIAVAIDNARLYSQLRDSEEQLREQVGALRRDMARSHRFSEIVGNSPAIEEVFRLMESAASSPIAVLIQGETGTGKELVARGVHRASKRADRPFLAVNCAALPETLLESELFGHRRGAFTGATQDRRGLFEVAGGGTVFLDEIGEMSPAMQAKLLRVIEEGEVVPLGDSRPRAVDVRLLSATNRDLEREVREHRFRDDLYFRIAAFPIQLPPLRERREDIPALVDHFLKVAGKRHRKEIRGVAPAALPLMIEFDWPGNVRELQNELERAVALAAGGDTIGLGHLSSKLVAPSARRVEAGSGGQGAPLGGAASVVRPAGAASAAPPAADGNFTLSLREARAGFEARYIARVLELQGGNVSRAARILGLSRAMLHKKIKLLALR
jgi:transcriptional regulator with GAF, ATPase, and Fis domain